MFQIQLQGQFMNSQSQFSLREEIDAQNPEDLTNSKGIDDSGEIRCRFCYENSKPLISVCACTGSIQFVHEECILNWIQKKLQISEGLEIPHCEICQQKYQAKMKIGRKKLSFDLLALHIKEMKNKQIGQGIIHIIVFLACIITILVSLNILYHDVGNFQTSPAQTQLLQNRNRTWWEILQFVFTNIVVQIYGIAHFLLYIKSKQKWVQDSMVQIVEVILQPNLTIKY